MDKDTPMRCQQKTQPYFRLGFMNRVDPEEEGVPNRTLKQKYSVFKMKINLVLRVLSRRRPGSSSVLNSQDPGQRPG